MPLPGGRPPWPGRNNNRIWELQEQRNWDYNARLEEIDSDDDSLLQGVELNPKYRQPRHRSDELRFTGIDLGAGIVPRRRLRDAYDAEFTPSEDEDEDVYRKEDVLVQRALERIARARALGKVQVKLSRAEIDALERLERNPPRPSIAPKAAPKSKKEPAVKRKPVENRKDLSRSTGRSASDSPKKGSKQSGDARGRGKSNATTSSARESRETSLTPYPLSPPDLDYEQRVPYPQGYPVRPSSNQSLRQYQHPGPPQQHPHYTQRYSSNPDVHYGNRPGSNSSRSSRPDPSEMDWEPRARSTSSLLNVPLDQLPYQTSVGRAPRFDPTDPRYASPQRRIASGPPAIHQSQASKYRRPQDELFLPEQRAEVYNYLASDDEEDEVDDEDDSDYDAGMEVVEVSERPEGYAVQTRSAAAAASSSPAQRTRVHGKATSVKSKKGR